MAKTTKRRPTPKRQPSTAERDRLEKRRQLQRMQRMERDIRSTANRLQRLVGAADDALVSLAAFINVRADYLARPLDDTRELGVTRECGV